MQAEPKTHRGRQTRNLIVGRAAELIAQQGAGQMIVNDVLAAAGASKSRLHHYFADRDALVEAAVAPSLRPGPGGAGAPVRRDGLTLCSVIYR